MLSISPKNTVIVLVVSILVVIVCFSFKGGLEAAEQVGSDWSRGVVEYASLEGHEQGIVSAVFSPDGRYLTLGNKDFHANIWDASTGKSLALLEGFNSWSVSIAYSPDGRFLATEDYEKVRLWKVPSGESFSVLNECSGPLAFSPEGDYLVTEYKTSEGEYQIKLWSFPSCEFKKTVETAHEKIIRHIAWNPDGILFASSSDDGTLKLWNGASGELVRKIQVEGKVGLFSFSPDGRYLAAICGKDPGSFFEPAVVMLWEVSTGKLVVKIEGFDKGLEPITFSPDGKYIATGERKSGGAKASLWEVTSGKLVRTFEGHKYWVSKLAFSPDGRFLATGSADEMTLWDVSTGEKLQVITAATKGLTCIAFSPDGTCIATTSTDNTAKLWRAKE